MSTRSIRVTDCYPQPLTREQKRPDVSNREFIPVNDFVICDYADVSHGEDCEEFVVAKAPHPFDGRTAAGGDAPAGTLALPKGTHVVAHSGDTFEIRLDGTEMVAIRATDIVGVISAKPATAPAQAAASPSQPKPAAERSADVLDFASERAKRAINTLSMADYLTWLRSELDTMQCRPFGTGRVSCPSVQ